MKIASSPFDAEKEFGSKDDALRAGLQAKSLFNILSKVNHPVVVAIDGKWGTGKSTFLRMWENYVQKQDSPFSTIHFDCFEDDYLDDPFVSLTACIVEYAETNAPKNKVAENLKTFAAKVLTQLPGIALKATSAALLTQLPKGTTELAKKVSEIVVDDFSDHGEREIEKLLSSQLSRRNAAKGFGKILSELRCELNRKHARNDGSPLVIVIDELDRCRPDFALKLLERIKHFMNVPYLHFVLGINASQMASSVRAAYGQDVDAEAYLRKFVNLTINLREVSTRLSSDELQVAIRALINEFGLQDRRGLIGDCVFECAVPLNATFRDLDRIIGNLAVIMSGNNQFRDYSDLLLPALVSFKIMKPAMYERARQGNLKYHEVSQVFGWPEASAFALKQTVSAQLHKWLCAVHSEYPSNMVLDVDDAFNRNRQVQYQPDLLKMAIRVIEDLNVQ